MQTLNTQTRNTTTPRFAAQKADNNVAQTATGFNIGLNIGRLLKLALDRVVAANTAFREREHMRRLTDHLLDDVAMTRRDADHGGR